MACADTSDTATALDRFIEAFITAYRQKHGTLPHQPFDPEWPSECCQGAPDAQGEVFWQPVLQRHPTQLFAGLEAAFEQPVHPDLQTFYSRYWSDHLPASGPDGDLDLLMIWNEADYERLRENLVGHAFSKFRQRQPLTLFFACPVSREDYFISLDNRSGAVLLEAPGRPPLRQLSPSLGAFLRSLSPRV